MPVVTRGHGLMGSHTRLHTSMMHTPCTHPPTRGHVPHVPVCPDGAPSGAVSGWTSGATRKAAAARAAATRRTVAAIVDFMGGRVEVAGRLAPY
eukprot:4855964-Prymnesium_polylepis.1